MILRSLFLSNFKQYRDCRITFREGLSGIIGRNGSGKSSIFDAILTALFGEFSMVKEYIRNQAAAERDAVIVELELELDAQDYTVRREYRGKNLTAYAELKQGAQAIASGSRDVTLQVTKILGMGRDSFTRSIFAPQKELDQLSALTGAARREFIREILGVTKIDHIQQLVRDEARNLKNEIAGQQKAVLTVAARDAKNAALEKSTTEITALETEQAKLKANADQKEAALQEAEKKFKTEQKRSQEYSNLRDRFVKAEALQDRLEREIETTKTRIAEIKETETEYTGLLQSENSFKDLKKRLVQLEKQREIFLKIQSVGEQIGIWKNKRNDAMKSLEKNNILVTDAKSIFAAQKNAEAEEKKIEEEIEKIQSETGQLHGKIKALADLNAERTGNLKMLQERGEQADCPTCLRPLGDSLGQTITKFETERTAYKKEAATLLDQVKTGERMIGQMKSDLKNTREKIQVIKVKGTIITQAESEIRELQEKRENFGDSGFTVAEYEYTKTGCEKLSPGHDRFIALDNRRKDLPGLTQNLVAKEAELLKAHEAVQKSREALEALNFSEKIYFTASEGMTSARQASTIAARDLSTLREKLLSHKHESSALASELEADKKRREAIAQDESRTLLLSKLELLMNDFKNALLARIQPLIAHYSSSLFTALTRGRYESISIDDDFRFLIFDNGDYFPIERFSGGERDLANLCLRLALSQAIHDLEGAGSPAFLAFDEIFGSQDRERRQEILTALLRLQEQYRQILIISHDEDLKDEFPQILEVRRTQAGSEANWL